MKEVGSNEKRRKESIARITKKIDVLKKILRDGNVEEIKLPQNVTQFRELENSKLGIERIGSPNTLNVNTSPDNKYLIEQVIDLIESIRNARPGKKKAISSTADLLAEKDRLINKLKAEVSGIAADWHASQIENSILKNDNQVCQTLLAREKEKSSRLEAQLTTSESNARKLAGERVLVSVK